jgi:hypothetical protein
MAEVPSKVTTRLYFAPDVAPFGEMNLLRADHGKSKSSNQMNPALQIASGSVVREAWLASGWLQHVMDEQHITDVDAKKLALRVRQSVIDTFYFPDRHVSWYAVRPPRIDEVPLLTVPKRGLSTMPINASQVIGFASAKHDVSGNWLQKAIKRWRHPEKIYANVSDVDVRLAQQRRKLGVALFYASLGSFKPEQRPTTYVAARNKTLIEKLRQLGYEPTGSHVRTNLLPGVSIEEIRLQGVSVEDVKNRLVAGFPWLENARQIDA